jgi:hypothetical protein
MLRTTILLAAALVPWSIWIARGVLIESPGYDGVTEFTDREGPIATLPVFPQIAWNNIKWFYGTRFLDAFGGAGWLFDTYSGMEFPTWVRIAGLAAFAASCLVAWRASASVRQVILVLAFLLFELIQRPSGGAPRYWVSLFPFVLIVVLSAVESLRSVWNTRLKRPSTIAAAAGLVMGALSGLIWDHAHRQPQDDPVWNAFVRICQATRQMTPHDAVILSHNETAARFISQRHASFTEEDARFLRGEEQSSRRVYAIVPSVAARQSHGRAVPYEDLTTAKSEVTRNEFYTLYALLPANTRRRGRRPPPSRSFERPNDRAQRRASSRAGAGAGTRQA